MKLKAVPKTISVPLGAIIGFAIDLMLATVPVGTIIGAYLGIVLVED